MDEESSRNPGSVDSDAQSEIESDSSQNSGEDENESVPETVSPRLTKHSEHERLELIEEVYHQAKGCNIQESYYSSNIFKEFKTPTTKNTVLHIAAFYGNEEMADRVAQQQPHLIVSLNENMDTPLHVAARAGHISIIKRLLDAYCFNSNSNILKLVKKKNEQGNTMLHEAMKSRNISSKGTMVFDVLEACSSTGQGASIALPQSYYQISLDETNSEYQSVLYLAVEADNMEAVNRILDKCPENATPKGTSPLLVAMRNKNKEMLKTIVGKKEECIHLRDPYGALALHFAAGIGYLEGVVFLLERCRTCSIQRDDEGNLPLHLAARQGHVKVVKELWRHCLDLNEMLDKDGNNILHIAAENGKLDLVKFILKELQAEEMIHQKNKHRDTPLHVATRCSRPSIVYALTWKYSDKDKDKLNEPNIDKKTPLDIAVTNDGTTKTQNPSLRQASISLVRIALESAGAKTPRSARPGDVSGTEWFKDRVESLSVISTLIVTASVAACLAVPGEANGTANNLHKAMFKLFIFCITVSLFSSISATIILIWGKIGMYELLNLSMEVAMPLLGTALVTLSLAFLGGIYTVISKLRWLATTFVIISSILVMIIFVLYSLLFLPSTSTWKISRWISYYPFILLAKLAEKPRVPRFLSTSADTPPKSEQPPGSTQIHSMYREDITLSSFDPKRTYMPLNL
ncbi:hypothetical protein PIB30_036647 [Stylosanthes scabra]|uniref:PGG domain-containing protein n=1 Tax=Stylosanthes scabra TaxID=79078 RepID=A0ABU6UEU0_9FABA|nr:hypothetical protein [Stylosanthes scabra]